eukprot:GHRR01030882.1.p1 GENE.GHRR01030882.1~~GHRR01030882.1.p1  ORF type:complete len:194 (+),score=52.10 GHRR01030882.1:192-773(+)
MIGAAVRTGLPCPAHCRAPMQTRNYFTALVGLSLDDTPASSPTAIAAASRVAARSSSGKGSTTTTTVAAPAAADAATAAVAANGDSSLKPKPNRPKLADPLIWIDLEMTGLDIDKDTIIEIACIVTDGSLQQVIEVSCNRPAACLHLPPLTGPYRAGVHALMSHRWSSLLEHLLRIVVLPCECVLCAVRSGRQ